MPKASKEELLQKLLEHFLQFGILQHSLDELAKPLGLTRGAFCYYFKKRDKSIKQVIEEDLFQYVYDIYYRCVINPILSIDIDVSDRKRFLMEQFSVYYNTIYKNIEEEQRYCPLYLLKNHLYPKYKNSNNILQVSSVIDYLKLRNFKISFEDEMLFVGPWSKDKKTFEKEFFDKLKYLEVLVKMDLE